MLLALISCSFYSHSLNMKTRKLGVFRKPTRPSLPLKKESFESLRLPLVKGRAFRKPTRPSLPLRKAPPLISVFSPQGRRGKPPSGAQNRFALWLADHQRSTPWLCGMGPPFYSLLWDRLAITCYGTAFL